MSHARHALAVAALVAMTLLACMPTLSRVLHASQAPQAWGQAMVIAMHDAHDDAPSLPGAPAMGDACDYCALLGGPAEPDCLHAAVTHPAAAVVGAPRTARAADRASWTLGSRGPPAARAG